MEGVPVLWFLPTATPVPTPVGEFDPDTVTPGVIGFVLTFLVAVVVVFLVIDMSRRIRRINYRQQANERLDAEEAAARDIEG